MAKIPHSAKESKAILASNSPYQLKIAPRQRDMFGGSSFCYHLIPAFEISPRSFTV